MGLFYSPNRDFETKMRELDTVTRKYSARYLLQIGDEDIHDPDYGKMLDELQRRGTIRLIKEFAPTYRVFEISRQDLPAGPLEANALH
jgi:hypothetical protein